MKNFNNNNPNQESKIEKTEIRTESIDHTIKMEGRDSVNI